MRVGTHNNSTFDTQTVGEHAVINSQCLQQSNTPNFFATEMLGGKTSQSTRTEYPGGNKWLAHVRCDRCAQLCDQRPMNKGLLIFLVSVDSKLLETAHEEGGLLSRLDCAEIHARPTW